MRKNLPLPKKTRTSVFSTPLLNDVGEHERSRTAGHARLFTHTMLKAIRNLDYTVIFCQEIKTMKHFYHDLLGFPIYRDFGEWVELHVGASLLTLSMRGTGYDGVRDQHGLAPSIGSASLQLAFRVTPAEVESSCAELQQKGVEILQPPTNQPTGHRTLFLKDPEGNILEIYADL